MNFIAKTRRAGWWGLSFGLILAFNASRAGAQSTVSNYFGLTETYSTNLFFVNQLVTNAISVTNPTATLFSDLFVTNEFSGPVFFAGVTNFYSTNYTAQTNRDTFYFDFELVTNHTKAMVALVWEPLTNGWYTNIISAGSPDVTNVVLLTNVFQVFSSQANLGVSIVPVSQAAVTFNDNWTITNDWVTYSVTVTNLGPGTANGVLLTNLLPPGVIPISPGSGSYVSNQWVTSVGNLTARGWATYQFTVQPPKPGGFALIETVGAPGNFDSDYDNNVAYGQLLVTNYLTGTLKAGTNSAQIVNPQNGLLEQTVQVTNPGANPVQAVRLVVNGAWLTNRLYNASGTNHGQPYVVYPANLAPGGTVSLRLQYSPRQPFGLTNGQLQVYEMPATALHYTPKPATGYSTQYNVTAISRLANDGDLLLQFTNAGSALTVEYADNPRFTNALIAVPAINSGANRIQWLDYGPPGTLSAPSNSVRRFYRVIVNH